MRDNVDTLIKQLSEHLEYNPIDGMLHWASNRDGRARKGRLAGGLDSSTGYWRVRFLGKNFQAHRLAWLIYYGKFPDGLIDHINGNKTDNRIENLRDVDRSTNLHNQKKAQKGNLSGFLGVSYHAKSGKYLARITINNKTNHIGVFIKAEDAYAAYLEEKAKLEGFIG
jgi:hypothetical protein